MATMLHHISRQCSVLAGRSGACAAVSAPRARLVATANRRVCIAFPRYTPLAPVQTASFSSVKSKIGPMNRDITSRYVQLVGDDGKIRRDVPIREAMNEAKRLGVDLVQVANNNGQAVCRLFDAQKRLFSLKKSVKNSKPKQDKEVVFGVRIESNDLKTKAENVRKFLSKGHKVKVTVKFGREFHLKPKALEQLALIDEVLGEEVGGPDHAALDQYGGSYVHYSPRAYK